MGCLLVICLFWSAGTLLGDAFFAWNAIRQVNAQSYATVIGTITHSDIETHHSSKGGPSYSAAIKYTYQVTGKDFSGDRYRYGGFSTNNRSSAEQIVGALPVGKKVTVYYAPDDPADSILHPGLEGSDLFTAIFMTPFTLIMVGLWIALAGSIISRQRLSLAGGAKIWDDGFQARIRLKHTPAWAVAFVMMFLLTFASCFVIAFAWSANPPLTLAFAAWGIILGVDAIAYFWQRARLASGRFDLVIDTIGRTLKLPRTFGRTEDIEVPCGHVSAVEVETVEKQGGKGARYYAYAPTLVVGDRGATPRRERLDEWSDKTRANDFAEWLCERLQIKPSNPQQEARP